MGSKIPVAVLNDTRVDRHHGCATVMANLARLLDENGFIVTVSHPAHRDWRADGGFLDALRASRLLIVNGEGTIHHDRPTGRCLLEAGAAARAEGVPAALINAVWEENGPELARMLASFALVSLRDSRSAAEVRGAGVDCRVVPDLSLYEPDAAPERRGRDGIGFTDNVDRLSALELDACRRNARGEVISILQGGAGMAAYLRFLRSGVGLREDLGAPARLARLIRMRHGLWRAATPDTRAFVDRIARLRLLVSGRFHACALAIGAGTPFVAVPSNTGKIASLVRDAGLEEWRLGVPLEPAAIRSAAERGWSCGERRGIADFLARTRAEVDRLFRDLRSIAQ
jgi:polysaccharide pyruvyl transferase WcaK-like protein